MKNINERTCVICRNKSVKDSFIRIVRDKNGNISLDLDFNKNGRGCYICNNNTCIEKLKKSKALNRAYKVNVQEEIYDRILQEIKSTK